MPGRHIRPGGCPGDTVLGHAALDAAHPALPAERRGADEVVWTSVYAELPDATCPQLAAVLRHLPLMSDSSFEAALDLLLSALVAAAPGPAPGEEA